MCRLMKTSVLVLLLLNCCSGITVTLTSFAISSELTTVFVSPIPQSTETETIVIVPITTFANTEDFSTMPIIMPTDISTDFIPVTPMITSATYVAPSITFPTDIITESVLFTTSIGIMDTSFTLTMDSFITTSMIFTLISSTSAMPVIITTTSESILLTSLSTTDVTSFEIPVTLPTSISSQPVSTDTVTELFTSSTIRSELLTSSTIRSSVIMSPSPTTTGSFLSPTITPSVTTVPSLSDVIMSTSVIVTVTIPLPTPTVVPPSFASVIIRFQRSPTVKRDTGNYTDIEIQLANQIGISDERINILSLRQEENDIVINATIIDLNSTEFINLTDIINSRMVSITFQGTMYSSSSITLQPQQSKPSRLPYCIS